MIDVFAKLVDEWPTMVEALSRAGQPWPEAAIHADWAWWQRRHARGEIQKLPGRPSLARRWRWKAHRVARFLGRVVAGAAAAAVNAWPALTSTLSGTVLDSPISPEAAQVPLPLVGSSRSTHLGALATGPAIPDGSLAGRWQFASSPTAASQGSPDSNPAARANLTPRNYSAQASDSSSSTTAPQQHLDSPTTAVQQRPDSPAAAAQQESDSSSAARSDLTPRNHSGQASDFSSGPAAPQQRSDSPTTAVQQRSDSGPHQGSGKNAGADASSGSVSRIYPQEESAKIAHVQGADPIPGTKVDLLSSTYSSHTLSLDRERSSEERMPEIPANPPIPPLQEMLRIAKRWSGSEAPKARRWRIAPLEDTNWFLLEILPMREAATLDLVDALKDWDSYLERIARAPHSPDIKRFPKNWKSALRKQILLKASYVARQGKEGSYERERTGALERSGTASSNPRADSTGNEIQGTRGSGRPSFNFGSNVSSGRSGNGGPGGGAGAAAGGGVSGGGAPAPRPGRESWYWGKESDGTPSVYPLEKEGSCAIPREWLAEHPGFLERYLAEQLA